MMVCNSEHRTQNTKHKTQNKHYKLLKQHNNEHTKEQSTTHRKPWK